MESAQTAGQASQQKEASASRRSLRSVILPALYLLMAVLLAVFSNYANRNGQFRMSRVLAILALLLAVVVCVTLVPRLIQKMRGEGFRTAHTFRVTQRGALYLLTVLAIAFASFNTGNNLLILVLSVLLASLIVSGMVANAMLRKLKVSLNLPAAIHARQKVIFFLSLENLKKRLPTFALHLSGRFSLAGGQGSAEVQETAFPFIPPGGNASLRVDCRFPNRGVYTVERFQVHTSFPFGFFTRGRSMEVQGQVIVYPARIDLDALWMHFPLLREGLRESNRKGLGGSLYNIRPYRSGDMARFVHWKATAKQGQLMVKDFARDEDRPLKVMFSTYLPSRDQESLRCFEDAVSCIASLAERFYLRGRRFSFDSGEYQSVLKGSIGEYEALMQYLSQVAPASRKRLRAYEAEGTAILFAAGKSEQSDGLTCIDYLRLPPLASADADEVSARDEEADKARQEDADDSPESSPTRAVAFKPRPGAGV
ncbi:MAG TPA: DUF58 domain-containing protein [Acidobacteriota bacterium]|nr:DUF58 domain-containing protein [Acidobacteriota bacterium]